MPIDIATLGFLAQLTWELWRRWAKRRSLHPSEMQGHWSETRPCSFQIADHYDQHPRWHSLADVKVVVLGAPFRTGVDVFLIPSRRVARPLRHPRVLTRDSLALQIKRGASQRFCTDYGGRTLRGQWFTNESGFPMLYSDKYDRMLARVEREYLEK